MNFADGLTMTGVDGLTMTGVDGTTWEVNSVIIRQANGLTMTGVDGLTMTGVDGLQQVGEDGLTIVCRVVPAFVAALAGLTGERLWAVVQEWLQDEHMADWETAGDVEAVLKEMATFARRAEREVKPVLQMTTV